MVFCALAHGTKITFVQNKSHEASYVVTLTRRSNMDCRPAGFAAYTVKARQDAVRVDMVYQVARHLGIKALWHPYKPRCGREL